MPARVLITTALFSFTSLAAPALALEDTAPPATTGVLASLEKAASESKPLFEIRLRYETVDFDPFDDRANALTYRIRAGLETGAAFNTKLLIDFDHIEPIVNDFNSTINGRTQFPVVADPETTEINRLQLTNTSIEDTTITLGRQRVNFDDQRFIGSVGWRQNEQTLDAVRVENTSLGPIKANVVYVSQVNRIFGEDSGAGVFDGDSYLVNLGAETPFGKMVAFAYLIDIDQAGGVLSSQTFGARFTGAKTLENVKFDYAASYAVQSDYGSSNLSYNANYYTVSATASSRGFSGGVAFEALGDDDQRAFQTPLATLHKFNGWADIFLATPPEGLKDLNGSLGYSFGDFGALKNVKTKIIYHDFASYTGSLSYGSEIDAIVTARLKKLALLLKFADYSADDFSADKQVLWFQVDFRL